MPDIKRFYDLQQLDLDTLSLERALKELRVRMEDDSVANTVRDGIARIDKLLTELEPCERTRERTMQDIRGRLESIESRLYGGLITNSRELTAAEDQKTHLQTQMSDEENNLLELMMEIETNRVERKSKLSELNRLENEKKAQMPDLEREESQLLEKLTELSEDREQATSDLPTSELSMYERLKKDHNGHAIAKVERGMCNGCRITLPSAELQKVKNGNNLIHCSSCQKILFVA